MDVLGGAFALSVTSDGRLRVDASFDPQTVPIGYRGVVAHADLDGDGKNEIILQIADGTISVMQVTDDDDFANLTTVVGGFTIDDGYPESSALRRKKWTVSNRAEILDVGDFDGDGREDLLIRDGESMVVLKLLTDDSLAIGEIIKDDSRYEGLISKVDAFIDQESQGRRNLHSMFTDFGVANYVSSLQGPLVSPSYRYKDENLYPGSSDHDNNAATPPLVLTDEFILEGSGGTTNYNQQPWTNQYFKFSTNAQGMEISIQANSANTNKAYTAVKITGNVVTDIQSIPVSQASLTLVPTSPADHLVLIISSFETPLKYDIRSSAR